MGILSIGGKYECAVKVNVINSYDRGLVLADYLSHCGCELTCADHEASGIASLEGGKIATNADRNAKVDRLGFTEDLKSASGTVVVIPIAAAEPTPDCEDRVDVCYDPRAKRVPMRCKASPSSRWTVTVPDGAASRLSDMLTRVSYGEGLAIYDDDGQTHSVFFFQDLPVGFMNYRELPAAFTGLVKLGTSLEFTTVQLETHALQETVIRLILVDRTFPDDHAWQPQPMPAVKTFSWQPALQLVEGLHHIADQVILPTLNS